MRGEAQRGGLGQEAERAVLFGVTGGVAAVLVRAIAFMKEAPRYPVERLHERGVLVVVAEPAVDGGARERAQRFAGGDRVADLAVPAPVELGGVEVIAPAAGEALGARA